MIQQHCFIIITIINTALTQLPPPPNVETCKKNLRDSCTDDSLWDLERLILSSYSTKAFALQELVCLHIFKTLQANRVIHQQSLLFP